MSERTRVLITCGIFPPDIGGPARMIEQTAFDLSERGFDVSILTFGVSDQKTRPYSVTHASGKMDFLRKLLNMGDVDIIYTFDLYTAGLLSWIIGKILFGKKLVVRFAGDSAWEYAANYGLTNDDTMVFQDHFYGLGVALRKKIRKFILAGSDKVVAVSDYMRQLAEKIGVSPNKIKVIYNSIDFLGDPSSVSETELVRKKYGLENFSGKIILTAGRLAPWKGSDGVIRALAQLKKDGTIVRFKFLIIGEGQDRNRLEKLVQDEGLTDDVIFVGRVPADKIFGYYSLADVFVLNSNYEGLSHVLLEVLSIGKPIIASASGGNAEVIEHEKNGLLVEYNNVRQIMNALNKILSEEKWTTEGFKETCKNSLSKFNWENNISSTTELLLNLKNEK